jgi:hypothetical protein
MLELSCRFGRVEPIKKKPMTKRSNPDPAKPEGCGGGKPPTRYGQMDSEGRFICFFPVKVVVRFGFRSVLYK